MTKKDYINFAELLRYVKKEVTNQGWTTKDDVHREFLEGIADILEEDNERFDRNTFFNYVETGK